MEGFQSIKWHCMDCGCFFQTETFTDNLTILSELKFFVNSYSSLIYEKHLRYSNWVEFWLKLATDMFHIFVALNCKKERQLWIYNRTFTALAINWNFTQCYKMFHNALSESVHLLDGLHPNFSSNLILTYCALGSLWGWTFTYMLSKVVQCGPCCCAVSLQQWMGCVKRSPAQSKLTLLKPSLILSPSSPTRPAPSSMTICLASMPRRGFWRGGRSRGGPAARKNFPSWNI